jgi:hypothetical protein
MRKYISLQLVLLFFVVSCSNQEETAKQKEKVTAKLDGSWVIKRGVGKFADRQMIHLRLP